MEGPDDRARVRLLRSAVAWACCERIVEVNPLDGMRNPPHAAVRLHVTVDQVREILHYAAAVLKKLYLW